MYDHKSYMVWKCVNNLNKVSERKKVQLIWVPEQSIILGNEISGSLERVVALIAPTEPESFCPLGLH